MSSTPDNVKLGVCAVLYDGVNLGFTKGGVEVEVTTATHEVTVDQFGSTPIGELITGRTVAATVPLAETTLENLVAIMPGSQLITDGVKATGTITLATAVPVDGDRVTVAGQMFTFRTNPTKEGEVKITTGAAGIAPTAAALAEAIKVSDLGYNATSNAGVVTITARASGVSWNQQITANVTTAANMTVTPLAGGVTATSARVVVSTGVNVNLLSVAKELVLRPRGTTGEDDFIIHRAACPGALNYSYSIDNERIYNAAFKGYVAGSGNLFTVGRKA